jgi:hypothetical protein
MAWARRVCMVKLIFMFSSYFNDGIIACCISWFNNTAYPSGILCPTGPEESSQAFTFLVRDQRLG